MSQYTVLVVGMGKRGMHLATAFNANPKFKVSGICDIDAARLDDASNVHQCNLDHACLGAEVMLALQRSAAEDGQVPLPLTSGADEQALLKAKLGNPPMLVSCEQNKKEFGLG